MNETLYPTTSGHVVIKKSGDFHIIKDVKKGIRGAANQDLRDLLILCDGTRTIKEILGELSRNYREPQKNVKKKMIKSIEFLEDLHFLELKDSPLHVPLIIRDTNMKWPLDIVYLEVTNTCNLNCIHCYKEAGSPFHDELSTQEWLAIIDQLKEMGVVELCITGGEPLTRDDIFSILKYGADNTLETKLFTNGILLDEESVHMLKDIGVGEIMVSIDGATKETHEMIRGKNTFDKTIAAISLLTEAGMRVRSNTTLHIHNVSELDALVSMLLDLKVQNMVFDSFMNSGRGKYHEDMIPPMDIGKIIRETFGKSKRKNPGTFELKFTSDIQNQDPSFSFCGIGTSMCTIKANGDVCLCPVLSDPEYTAGNIRCSPLRDMWLESDIFLPFRTCKVDDMQCRTCQAKFECRGGCKARVIQFYGKPCMPDPWMCVIRGQDWPSPESKSMKAIT